MTYDEHRVALIEYLKSKVELCDWHGASDACNDLRELEATERARVNFLQSQASEVKREGV